MARCRCENPESCQCAVQAGTLGDLTSVGTGTAADPIVIDNPAYQIVASTAARDAIASPSEGWLAYVLSTDLLYRYTGSAWVPQGTQTLLETRLSVAATSITLSSINQEFVHLWLVGKGKTNRAGAGNDSLRLHINGDTTSGNYQRDVFNMTNGVGSGSAASDDLIGTWPGATAASGHRGHIRVLFPDYRDATDRQTWEASSGYDASGNPARSLVTVFFDAGTIGALTEVALKPNVGPNLETRSILTLSGVPSNA